MRITPLVALSIITLAASGAATAQELATVEVRAAESQNSLTLDCKDATPPNLKDVERVLLINDPQQTVKLRNKLLEAAAEACAQNHPRILVQRGQNGDLTWKPIEG